jgi:hypothetical protein
MPMKGWMRIALFVVGGVLLLVCPFLAQNAKLAGDAQLKILREMMPYWNRAESGGIMLLGNPADKEGVAIYRALLGLPTDGSGDSRLSEEWQAALPSLIDKLDRFFENAHLEPGTYTFPNPYYPLIKTGAFKAGSIPMNSDGDQPVITIPQTETVTFTVTPDHLKLLRHMNTRSFESYIEVMDAKRPYGDMTYFFIDVADALGRPIMRDGKGQPELSAHEIEDYQRLHGQMLWAVAAFLRYAKP